MIYPKNVYRMCVFYQRHRHSVVFCRGMKNGPERLKEDPFYGSLLQGLESSESESESEAESQELQSDSPSSEPFPLLVPLAYNPGEFLSRMEQIARVSSRITREAHRRITEGSATGLVNDMSAAVDALRKNTEEAKALKERAEAEQALVNQRLYRLFYVIGGLAALTFGIGGTIYVIRLRSRYGMELLPSSTSSSTSETIEGSNLPRDLTQLLYLFGYSIWFGKKK